MTDPYGLDGCISSPTVAEDSSGTGLCTKITAKEHDWEYDGVFALKGHYSLGGPEGAETILTSQLICKWKRKVDVCYHCNTCCFVPGIVPKDNKARFRTFNETKYVLTESREIDFLLSLGIELKASDFLTTWLGSLIKEVDPNSTFDPTVLEFYQIDPKDLYLAENKCKSNQNGSKSSVDSTEVKIVYKCKSHQ